MAYARLLDRENLPDDTLIERTIGREVFPVWLDTRRHIEHTYPEFVPEMVFYNAQQGWGLRYRQEARQLVMLFPERGGFSALVMLNPEEEARVMEKINYFNNRIRELLNQPSDLPQGRLLWCRVEDHTDFVGLKLLLDQKRI
ncbi:MAG: DUF3788 family protein [Anaerolineaceae bacterium]|jgi:hypothetical protein|nr:DUF3788 family protein [Anaerolineaceae bacterium]